MHTHCKPEQLSFQGFGRRKVVADFGGGHLTSDGGALLLREAALGSGVLRKFAKCFVDGRDQRRIEHTVEDLVSQRVLAVGVGYEDINDHDRLRFDPLLALAVGKADPTGQDRLRESDRGAALAGKSTLNRLELALPGQQAGHRYHKISYIPEAIDRFFVETFLDAFEQPPKQIVLDLDATDDPLHGSQEGRFFHGYYGCYCYLPLYIFCGEHLLCARLRTSNIDASAGSLEEVIRIVEQIRQRWAEVKIVVRGDSGFARDNLMSWCEGNGVFYIFGLQRNCRLISAIQKQLKKAKKKLFKTSLSARVYRDFRYRTLNSWSKRRRVVGKAEALRGKDNPRFVVTNLDKRDYDARALYEDLYCARGDMENRIKEQQLGLFADRTSSATFCANQLRLWFSSVAYLLMTELRRVGLKGTEYARAQVTTIRTKLLKIGAHFSISARRVFVRFATGYPYAKVIAAILANQEAHYRPLRA